MADVKLEDLGFDDIIKEDKRLQERTLRVGILDAEQAQKAVYNEFGSEDTPARPFMRTTFDVNVDQVVQELIARYQDLGITLTVESALEALGQWYAAKLKNSIEQGSFAPNKPSTLKAKQGTKPLIDTGAMLNSITFEVK